MVRPSGRGVRRAGPRRSRRHGERLLAESACRPAPHPPRRQTGAPALLRRPGRHEAPHLRLHGGRPGPPAVRGRRTHGPVRTRRVRHGLRRHARATAGAGFCSTRCATRVHVANTANARRREHERASAARPGSGCCASGSPGSASSRSTCCRCMSGLRTGSAASSSGAASPANSAASAAASGRAVAGCRCPGCAAMSSVAAAASDRQASAPALNSGPHSLRRNVTARVRACPASAAYRVRRCRVRDGLLRHTIGRVNGFATSASWRTRSSSPRDRPSSATAVPPSQPVRAARPATPPSAVSTPSRALRTVSRVLSGSRPARPRTRRRADRRLLQAQHQQFLGELVQHAVQLADHDRDEEDHVHIGHPQQVEAARTCWPMITTSTRPCCPPSGRRARSTRRARTACRACG